MKKLILLLTLFVLSNTNSLEAQDFLRPFDMVSHKKTTYITNTKGKEIQGSVKKLKRKKGLIKEINIKNKKGVKKTIPINQIDFAYLPQNGLEKVADFNTFLYDATQWNKGLYDQDRIKEGYAFFEKSKVMVKKKEMTLLMQLLNPGVCSRIKVYHDPFANETVGVGIGAIRVAGGNDKSYYIRIDDGVAFKLSKKKYKKMFGKVFGDCKTVLKAFGKAQWSKFEETVFAYNTACKE